MFHKIASVSYVGDMTLEAVFQNGEIRRYDVSPLLARFPQFAALRDVAGLFDAVHVEAGGYGVAWNDDLDIESEDIWELGVPIFRSTNQKPETGNVFPSPNLARNTAPRRRCRRPPPLLPSSLLSSRMGGIAISRRSRRNPSEPFIT